ncbi:MAG: ATP-binding cassette domain-containing protein [Deltaproteobacteria bacterium]|nr:ATP-binding cassette domain-containing protein [Deltaproteobacteria bacterium]
MANISINNLSKAFGGKKLFEEVTVTFKAGNRYGLTGPNGAGKTTFMRIVSGQIDPDTGSANPPRRLSVLEQDHFAYDEARVLDCVMMGNRPLWDALQEKEVLLAKGEDLTDEDGMKLGELEGVIAEEDGYTAESDAATLLSGLGVVDALHDKKLAEIPASYKVRTLLAKALFGKPDALLLDEPTNNLDLESIRWLEKFLEDYEGVLITISHDRHFINAVCTHIADIDYETIILYPGGYDDMVQAKVGIRSRLEHENTEREKKIAQLQDFVQRFSAGTRASQVQSRKKQIEKLKVVDLKRSNIARPFIRFDIKQPSGKRVVELKGVDKRWPDVMVCDEMDSLVMKGDKIGIIGTTGVGKTTLCELLTGRLQPDHGEIEWGHNTSVGYLPQDHRSTIPDDTTVAEYLHSFDRDADKQTIRSLLGRMLFRGEEGDKPTKALSGGEAVRLIFSRLMLQGDNVLVLDDPTTHLDLESILALGEALEQYEGTVFMVTHDRELIESVCNRIWAFTPNGLIDFPGTYEEFLEKDGQQFEARAWR